MRYNKQELIAIASQIAYNFDREGILVLKERQDKFFRRSEGVSVRWFRLRGNLLFYLKGPEPCYDVAGLIVLEQHQIKLQLPTGNGHWPFQIVYEDGVSYTMAAYGEENRLMWIKAIQVASYDNIRINILTLHDKLNRITPIIDIASYRFQNGIVTDMNELPMCELALSCDNLLCDIYGRPPSPLVIIYISNIMGKCVLYGRTEVVEASSNPSFSKTVLFRTSDRLRGDTIVKIVVYDIKERVSETAVPMGFTTFNLSTIQDAQRLRIPLLARQSKKTVGFVSLNGWSLESSYVDTTPLHSNDKSTKIDMPLKICHRRSQSLPPKLGLKLKFPSHGGLLKHNFVNIHQVTYRFHSGLGGDITVHEIMAESKFCFDMPVQLLDIYIQREEDLIEELILAGRMCGQWDLKQRELIKIHQSLLNYYYNSKRTLQCDRSYFKASCKKDNMSMEFVPVNLHLQRMWVYNDTLNKSGFHDIVTCGAFAMHTPKSEKTGGLIRLVQQVKDINSSQAALHSATANKIQAEYDNIIIVGNIRLELMKDILRIMNMVKESSSVQVSAALKDVRNKLDRLLSFWNPKNIEASLAVIGPEEKNGKEVVKEKHVESQCNHYYCINYSSCSTVSTNTVYSSYNGSSFYNDLSTSTGKTNGYQNHLTCEHELPELQFYNDYFLCDRNERYDLRSNKNKYNQIQCLPCVSKRNSLQELTSSVSLQCSKNDSSGGIDHLKISKVETDSVVDIYSDLLDMPRKERDLLYLHAIGSALYENQNKFSDLVANMCGENRDSRELECLNKLVEDINTGIDDVVRWLRISHAVLRLRTEAPTWSRDNATLQIRRDICFCQALTAVTTGLVCWLSSAPGEVIVKLLSSGLGPLCGFEGLLSLYASEKAMWGDMVVAVEDLQTVFFVLTKSSHSSILPRLTGNRGSLMVHIPISDSLYSKFNSIEHLTFTVTAVFFNIGINEKATLAEALGETTPQYHSNSDNLDRLNKYYYKYNKVFHPGHMVASRVSSRTKPLEEVMENLRLAVQKRVPKNVEILHLAASAVRLMHGVRFTSCKSGKDRTGMSATLEQCTILTSEYRLAEHESKKALNVIRSEGCRRENTYKNIGIKKYAFTKKQVRALPETYRPPVGTYGSCQT